MAEVRYGLVEGSGKGREYPVASDQYFHRRGGHFVYLSSGNLTLNATAANSVIAGWVEMPKHAAGYDTWKSSTTAAADSVFMIYADPENVFEIPANEVVASVAAAVIGRGAKLVTVGSTTAMRQFAKIQSGGTASPLAIVDIDTTNKTLKVKVKPMKKQPL